MLRTWIFALRILAARCLLVRGSHLEGGVAMKKTALWWRMTRSWMRPRVSLPRVRGLG